MFPSYDVIVWRIPLHKSAMEALAVTATWNKNMSCIYVSIVTTNGSTPLLARSSADSDDHVCVLH